MTLTKRQSEILRYIEGFLRFRGYSPSFCEIAEEFGYRSVATVHEHIANLQEKGYIRKEASRSRSIEMIERDFIVSATTLPLLGNVAAGVPIEVISESEQVAVPDDMITGSPSEHYVLRVQGDSMIDEQIRDGDHVIVQARQTAHNGEMVIALVDGEAATMKKIYMEGERVRLQPANASLQPLYFPASRVRIQGVVVGVIRRYRAIAPV